MAHARRKFKEAEVANRSADRGKGRTGKANWALNHIQKLYRIETRFKGQPAEQKYQVRQAELVPLLNQYKAWLNKLASQVPPNTALGNAIGYSLNQWQKLVHLCG